MSDKNPSPADLRFSEIKVGSAYRFSKVFSQDDILAFVRLTGDFNPLHTDPEYASSFFKQNVIHGMLAGSLFSTLVGMYCPGKKCLYLSQELRFVKPIYPNQEVVVKGTVTGKTTALKILSIRTEAWVDGQACIKGQAKVRVLE